MKPDRGKISSHGRRCGWFSYVVAVIVIVPLVLPPLLVRLLVCLCCDTLDGVVIVVAVFVAIMP